MPKNNRTLRTLLSSTAGIIIVGVLLFFICLIFKNTNIRLDCTEDKLYTLSDATKTTLKKLDKNVTIRFYYSKDVAEMPVVLKNYAKRVDDMLREYEIRAGGRLKVEKLNPKPDTDAEDSANLDGITGQGRDALGLENDIYLGIAVRCADQTVALPFLSPERESLLEYDITRSLISVTHPVKHKIGVMSALKIFGGIENPAMMMQGQGGMTPPWLIITELKKEYNVTELPLKSDSIPDDIDILLVIHPKGITEQALFALDQFVLRGGRLIAFLDPISLADMQSQPRQQMQYMPPNASSSLGNLLTAWGITFSTENVVIDRECATAIRQSANGAPERLPNVLSLAAANMAENDPATAQLTSLLMLNAGAFSGTPSDGLVKTVLIKSSDDSQNVEKFMTQRSGDDMMRDFRSDEKYKQLAIRLTGKFKTAFPDGKPASKDAKDDKDAKDAKDSKDAKGSGDYLKESLKDGAVVLVSDVDMLYDAFCVRKNSIFGQTFYQPLNNNLSFVQNMMETMSGDSVLFQIRSRGVKPHPFERVKELELAATDRYKDEIRKFEEEVRGFQRELNEMQSKRKPGERELLSREQKEAVVKIRKREAEARQNLKNVRKNMRKDIESLENNMMLVNIGLMPLLVVIGGIAFAVVKRVRMSAK